MESETEHQETDSPQSPPDVAKFLLDHPHRFEIRRPVECVATKEKELNKVPGDIATGNIEPAGVLRKRKTVVDGNNVGNTIARVDDNSREQACPAK